MLDPGPDFAGQPGGDLPGEQKPTHEQYGRSKGTWAVCKGKIFSRHKYEEYIIH